MKIPKVGTPEHKAYMRKISANGGRAKKGKKHKTTIEREKVLELAKDIIAGRTKRLIDTQSILAMGAIKVYVIHSHWEGSGKNKKRVKDKAEIVSDDEEIGRALDYEFGEGDNPSDDDSYYFVMTKEPDNSAIDSLLNRTFGKATENKNLTVDRGMGELLDEMEEDDD